MRAWLVPLLVFIDRFDSSCSFEYSGSTFCFLVYINKQTKPVAAEQKSSGTSLGVGHGKVLVWSDKILRKALLCLTVLFYIHPEARVSGHIACTIRKQGVEGSADAQLAFSVSLLSSS